MEDALVQCVQLSLANCLVGNATFFAEQMVAISRLTPSTPPSEHSLHLLAMCYIQNGRHAMAFETLKGCISPKNLYLRATAAIAISQYSDAEAALMPPNGITTDEHYKLVPNGAYGIYLLGVISHRTNQNKKAKRYYTKSLSLNPFLWCAYEGLCQLGADMDPVTFFGADEAQIASLEAIQGDIHLQSAPKRTSAANTTRQPSRSAKATSAALPAPAPEISKMISTPALAKKMRMRLSPDDEERGRTANAGSLSRRLFETPQTPADSMIGLASTSTPMLAQRRGRTIAVPAPIAMKMGDAASISRARPAVASTAKTTSSTSSSSSTTPARPSAMATPGGAKFSTVAASPKKRPTITKTTAAVSTVTTRATTTSSATPASAKEAIGPTPRRGTASSVTGSTAASSSASSSTTTPATGAAPRTARVIPPRAVKATRNPSQTPASSMTPIPSSLPLPPQQASVPPPAPSESLETPPGAFKVPSAPTRPAGPPLLGRRTKSQGQATLVKMAGHGHVTDGAESAEEEEDDLRPIPSLSFNLFGSSGSDPKAKPPSTSESSVLEPIRELDTSETASPATTESIPATVRSTGGSTGAEPSTTSTTTSSDLDNNTGDSKAEEGSQERERAEPSSVRSGSEDGEEDERQTGEDDEEDEDTWTKGMAALLGILRQLGEATRKMEIYQCRHAILNFSKLPLTMQRSAYVLSSIGRCYYEMSDQDRAREAFEKLRRLWPNSTLNLALYSNILWHHRARHELSQLSNELVNLDARSPEAWCAMANAFSLEGDGSSAISALERAVQVRPSNSYPYTLLGQEYLAIDNHDRAFAAFREAVKLDSRHYRGWYGLGLLYYNQSKFTEAQAHFLRALEINPHSAILHTCLGLCFYAKRELGHTLPYLKMALNISPQNTTALYHLTSALISHAMAKLPINGSNPSNKANIIDTNEIAMMLSKLKTKLPTCGALHMLQGRYYRIMSIISDSSKKATFDAEGTAEFEAAKELDPKLNNNIMLADVVLYEPPELS